MQISIGENNVHFSPVEIKKVNEFIELATSKNWAPAVFKDNYRKKENFLRADVIALDIDNDESVKMTIEEAKQAFADYKHVIMPTRNHQKEKNGEVKDRFRVLLFLSRPITSEAEYYSTIHELHKQFPAADPACVDPSRLFYPSTDCVSYSTKGKVIDPIEPQLTVPANQITAVLEPGDVIYRGELSRKTLKFMLEGARPGSRHRELYNACRDYHQNGYSKEEFIRHLSDMIERGGNWAQKKLSAKDLSTIDDAFRVDPKHAARESYQRAFIFEPISEVLNCEESLDWLVEEFLSVGSISIIAGDPKAGKSTLIRQLAKSVCRGEPFLGRKVKQGTVFYTALEEHRPLLKKQFRQIGITENDPIRIHVGSPIGRDTLATLEDELSENEVALLVIDTFLLGLKIKEPNNYSEVNEALTPFRDLARDTGTHIILVHHNNKSGMGANAISGSKAISGAVDCFMVFQSIGRRRFLTTGGRGIKPFYDHELIYQEDKLTYVLGEPKGFDDEDNGSFSF